MLIPGRDDVSDDVIHFTKGDTDADAFDVLERILDEHILRGGLGMIKATEPCVCFTEAPLDKIAPTITAAQAQGKRYKPFGLVIPKTTLYAAGGRPVIYGPDAQFVELPNGYKWRHVRYEPNATPAIDFSWEREWRIQTTEFHFTPDDVRIIVPTADWYDLLREHHEREQDYEEELARPAYGDYAYQVREPFPWVVQILS